MCNLSLLFTTEENNNYIIPEFNCTIITKYDAIEKDKSAFCVSQYFKTRYQTLLFRNKII